MRDRSSPICLSCRCVLLGNWRMKEKCNKKKYDQFHRSNGLALCWWAFRTLKKERRCRWRKQAHSRKFLSQHVTVLVNFCVVHTNSTRNQLARVSLVHFTRKRHIFTRKFTWVPIHSRGKSLRHIASHAVYMNAAIRYGWQWDHY